MTADVKKIPKYDAVVTYHYAFDMFVMFFFGSCCFVFYVDKVKNYLVIAFAGYNIKEKTEVYATVVYIPYFIVRDAKHFYDINKLGTSFDAVISEKYSDKFKYILSGFLSNWLNMHRVEIFYLYVFEVKGVKKCAGGKTASKIAAPQSFELQQWYQKALVSKARVIFVFIVCVYLSNHLSAVNRYVSVFYKLILKYKYQAMTEGRV